MTYDRLKKQTRRKLVKIVKDCDELIADMKWMSELRPHLAPSLAPDDWAGTYARRQWAVKALVALEADEPIPDPPDDDEGESR